MFKINEKNCLGLHSKISSGIIPISSSLMSLYFPIGVEAFKQLNIGKGRITCYAK